MTLGELIDQVLTMTNGEGGSNHADIANLLNRVMDEDSRDLMIPEMTVEYTDVLLPFNLPLGARAGGLFEVRRLSDGYLYPALTAMEANRVHPGYLEWTPGDTVFVVFDPATVGLEGTVYPAPVPATAQSYLVSFAKAATPMTALDDVAFDGMIPEYHRLLAHHAAYELLMQAGDDRWQPHYNHYKRMMAEAFTYSRPSPVMATRIDLGGGNNGYADD